MDWIAEKQTKAADKVKAEMAKPVPTNTLDGEFTDPGEILLGCDGVFDPWEIIGCMYGSYSDGFDICAIHVLEELLAKKADRDDLASYMFREVLCKLDLCDYGTSPRVCFATPQFYATLPELIAKWKAFSTVQWGK